MQPETLHKPTPLGEKMIAHALNPATNLAIGVIISYLDLPALWNLAQTSKCFYVVFNYCGFALKIKESSRTESGEDLASLRTANLANPKDKIVNLENLCKMLHHSGLIYKTNLSLEENFYNSLNNTFYLFKDLINNNLIKLILQKQLTLEDKINKCAQFAPILYDINCSDPLPLMVQNLQQVTGAAIDLQTQKKLLDVSLANYQQAYGYPDDSLIDHHIKNVFLKEPEPVNIHNTFYRAQLSNLRISFSPIGNNIWVYSNKLFELNNKVNFFYGLQKNTGKEKKNCDSGDLENIVGTQFSWLSFALKDFSMFKVGLWREAQKAYKITVTPLLPPLSGHKITHIEGDVTILQEDKKITALVNHLTDEKTRFIFMVKEAGIKVENEILKNSLAQNTNLLGGEFENFSTVEGCRTHEMTNYSNNWYSRYIPRNLRVALQQDILKTTGAKIPLGQIHNQQYYSTHQIFQNYKKENNMAPEFYRWKVSTEQAALIEEQLATQGLITKEVGPARQYDLVKQTAQKTVTFTFSEAVLPFAQKASIAVCQNLELFNSEALVIEQQLSQQVLGQIDVDQIVEQTGLM
jgi:hypothetical protein